MEARDGARHHSIVGRVLKISHLCFVSVLFSAPSLLEMKFFLKLFPLVSVLFGGGVSKPTSKQKLNMFIASNEIVFATHTSEYDFTLQTNAFITSNEI